MWVAWAVAAHTAARAAGAAAAAVKETLAGVEAAGGMRVACKVAWAAAGAGTPPEVVRVG